MWKWYEKLKRWEDGRQEVYLGYVTLSFETEGDSVDECTVYFYAQGANPNKYRRVAKSPRGFPIKQHRYWRERVIPWLYGENLWGPIDQPSEWLKAYTSEKVGFEYKGNGNWAKRPSKILSEGNVIAFTLKET
jgi:hypothetical protein